MGKSERKKELIAAYKERPSVGGICAIRNTVSGRVFLFSSPDPAGRENRFRFSVSTDSCVESVLFADWKQDGPGAFSFETLERLEKKSEETDAQFKESLAFLEEVWRERLTAEGAVFY